MKGPCRGPPRGCSQPQVPAGDVKHALGLMGTRWAGQPLHLASIRGVLRFLALWLGFLRISLLIFFSAPGLMPRHRSQESWHFLSKRKDEESGRDLGGCPVQGFSTRAARWTHRGLLKLTWLSPAPDHYIKTSWEGVQVLFYFRSSPDVVMSCLGWEPLNLSF